MKKILYQWWDAVLASAMRKQHSPSSKIKVGSQHAMRLHLVQVVVRDLLRRQGLPLHWIEPQMLSLKSLHSLVDVLVVLKVKHWDEQLLDHLYALQEALLREISRFDPHSTQWLYGITWQLDFAQTCPYRELPDKSFWLGADPPSCTGVHGLRTTDAAAVVNASLPASISLQDEETFKDLERLLLIGEPDLTHSPAH